MENPIKMDDLGVPLFFETPMWRFFLEFRYCTGEVKISLQLQIHFLPTDPFNPDLFARFKGPYSWGG